MVFRPPARGLWGPPLTSWTRASDDRLSLIPAPPPQDTRWVFNVHLLFSAVFRMHSLLLKLLLMLAAHR